MKNLFYLAIALCSSYTAVYGMQAADFKVFFDNKISRIANVPVLVTYKTNAGKTVSRLVDSQKPESVKFVGLAPGFKIAIQPYGSGLSTLYTETSINRDDLLAQWNAGKSDSSSPLVVVISSSGMVPPYKLVVGYDFELSGAAKRTSGKNPLAEFPGITKYSLQYILDPQIINNTPKSDTILVSAIPGIARATTAEDVYRYILGLSEKYSKDDVRDAYKRLSLTWHPDKTDHADKTYAASVFTLIDSAFKGLNQALEDKAAASTALAKEFEADDNDDDQ